MCANATVWKARSQAANHGYSHGSGMEMTSRALRCRHVRFRIAARPCGGAGSPASPSCQRLTLYAKNCLPQIIPANASRRTRASSRCAGSGRDRRVEGIGLRLPERQDLLRIDRGRDGLVVGEPLLEAEHELHGLAGGDVGPVPPRGLGPGVLGVDGRRAGDHVVVDPVLGVARDRVAAPDPGLVGRVVAEQWFGCDLVGDGMGVQPVSTESRMLGNDVPVAQAQVGSALDLAAGPGVAEPQRRQDVDRADLGAVVGHRHPHHDVLGAGLGVLDLHGEEPVLLEHPGVEQLELPHVLAPGAVLVTQALVGEGCLRVVVAPVQP